MKSKITYIKNKNIFNSKMQVIVNTVNCYGVMGAGIALQAKKRYPDMFEDYKIKCQRKMLHPGDIYLWKSPSGKPPFILNFATKDHWRNPSKLEWIEKGLQTFKKKYQEWGINSIAIPALGCGNGELWWYRVKRLIESYLSNLPDLEIEVYEPRMTKTERFVEDLLEWLEFDLKILPHSVVLGFDFIGKENKILNWKQENYLFIAISSDISPQTLSKIEDRLNILHQKYKIPYHFTTFPLRSQDKHGVSQQVLPGL